MISIMKIVSNYLGAITNGCRLGEGVPADGNKDSPVRHEVCGSQHEDHEAHRLLHATVVVMDVVR